MGTMGYYEKLYPVTILTYMTTASVAGHSTQPQLLYFNTYVQSQYSLEVTDLGAQFLSHPRLLQLTSLQRSLALSGLTRPDGALPGAAMPFRSSVICALSSSTTSLKAGLKSRQ